MKFEKENIYFTKIIVIQSLPDNERKTGTEIHNDTISRRAWVDPNLSTELIDINRRNELFKLLERINKEAAEFDAIPFIHFETHGTEKGISLKSGQEVLWKEIIPKLREININSGNNLFVSISSCWGGNIQFEIEIIKPCPFRGFIGPMDKIYPDELLETFTNFFNELLLTDDFEKAINQLNINNNSRVEFHHLNSESYFEIVLKLHKAKYAENTDLHDERINSITNTLWNSDPNIKVKYKTKNEFAKAVRRLEKRELPKSFNKLRNIFLHIN